MNEVNGNRQVLDDMLAKIENGTATEKELQSIDASINLGLQHYKWPDKLGRCTTKWRAQVTESEGDKYAQNNKWIDACDCYFVAVFQFAAAERNDDATRVKQKFDRNFGGTYDPTTRSLWHDIRNAILEPKLYHYTVNSRPLQILNQYFMEAPMHKKIMSQLARYIVLADSDAAAKALAMLKDDKNDPAADC